MFGLNTVSASWCCPLSEGVRRITLNNMASSRLRITVIYGKV